MDFNLSQEHEMWRQTVREFVEREVPRNYIRETDLAHQPPWEAWNKIAEQGWLGLLSPEEYGGIGGDIFHVSILLEEVGRRSQDLAVMVFRTILHCNMKLDWCGTEEQKRFFLPKAARGEIKFAIGVSEPDTGNDVQSIKTHAHEDGDHWVLNGHKMWTTGFQLSDYCVVLARTDPNAPKRYQGLTNFMVDSKAAGITYRTIPTLGRWPIPTCEVWFDNVKVPKNRVLGEVNQGWSGVMKHLETERFCAASIWMGQGEAALEDSLAYAKTRQQFGQPIGKFQAVAHKLANMRIQLDASRLLLYRAGQQIQEDRTNRMQMAIMKHFISETFKQVTLDAMQVCGGFGYSMEMDIQRYLRDALLAPIGPGSNEIQKNVIAKELGL